MTGHQPGRTKNDQRRRFYNQAEVAAIFGVQDATVARWCDEGRLPLVRLGRRKFIDRATVDKLSNLAANPDEGDAA